MADRRIVVDPVTRIEGHLRVQAVVDSNNIITDSQSTGTMWSVSAGFAPAFMLWLPFAV